jgi:hypothetical protein
MAVSFPRAWRDGQPAPAFRLSKTCGICGSFAIRYRDKYSHEAVCRKCADKYVHDWYLAERMDEVEAKEVGL